MQKSLGYVILNAHNKICKYIYSLVFPTKGTLQNFIQNPSHNLFNQDDKNIKTKKHQQQNRL